MSIRAPRGTKDVLPCETYKWEYIESIFRNICKKFGYKEIRTPMFEHTKLFERGVGETTDVVQKEMYTFEDKSGRSITLKPEGTASVVRAFIENKMYADAQPTKLFYVIPCFRYEKPQAGRLRQFHQFGIEVFGTRKPSIDVEVMSIVSMFYDKIGIKNIELNINSIGCPECRENYNKILQEYLTKKIDSLCNACKDRYDKNPMRILDCKNPKCKEELKDVPLMIEYLCDECENHFEQVKSYLDLLNIEYVVNPKIVRGLDYYTKTAFEFVSYEIGAQGTVCGGGRYDGLVKDIGGPEIPGIGFGMGIERLLMTMENNNITIPNKNELDIFIVTIGEKANEEAFKLLYSLREENISADKDHMDRSIRSQFKYSNKINATYTIVIGEDEINKDVVSLKDMKTGDQEEVKLSNLIQILKNKLGR